jgi:uncharacterized damage-inducible protein DinB
MTSPTATATPAAGAPAIPSRKQQFIDTFAMEHEKTRRVVDAYPAEQADLKPHPRSNSALQLVWTFTIEERLIAAALEDRLNLGGSFPPAPSSWDDVVSAFKNSHAQTLAIVQNASDEQFEGTVKFFTGPKKIEDVPKMDFLWFILCDQIHHRGQLSVYLRMAGGKVPAIYGPSADEPWF